MGRFLGIGSELPPKLDSFNLSVSLCLKEPWDGQSLFIINDSGMADL